MLTKFQNLKPFSVSKANVNAFRYLVFNMLWTNTESTKATKLPDLPRWVKANPASAYEDEDFVIPSVANWIKNHRLDDPHKVAQQCLSVCTESDIDKISRILKNRYSLPEEAAQALDVFDLITSENTVEQLLKRFQNDWIPAFGFFKWSEVQVAGYKHSPKLYKLMVDILGKAKKFELMWELIEEMNNLGGHVSLFTLVKAMRRLVKAHMYKEAIDVFREIERFGLSKDVATLNNLMIVLVSENCVEQAYKVFSEFKKSIVVNDLSFNILIHGWCKARRFDDARKTMEDMKKHGFQPDKFSYTCFIKAYCHKKDFQRVYALLDEMESKGCRPCIVTYTIVMHALGKARQINEAFCVYEKVKESSCIPDTSFYNSLIFILGKAGRSKDAHEVFYNMPKQGIARDVVTYNTMISCACDHSLEEEALMLLKKMEVSCQPRIETYKPLLKMCCRKKRMKVLYFLLNHMFDNNVSIDLATYSFLISGLCKNGKVELACSFFEEMVYKGLVPQDSLYKRLIKVLEAKNMVEAKENIENLMSKEKEITC